MIVYDENVRSAGAPIPYHSLNASKGYVTHYGNLLYLQFIVKSSDRISERQQALKEMQIAERKMAYWKKHPNWDRSEVEPEVVKLNKHWGVAEPVLVGHD